MKSRFACFIDAGYVRAAIAVVDDESKNSLGPKEVCAWLEQLACKACPGSELLRHYWCDAAFDGMPSGQHAHIAALPNVKLRLGRMSSQGKQKGVDARMNSDMRELAELRSVDDIILFTGDEDMSLGVSQAQTFGARVHLVVFKSSRIFNSAVLMHEADTVTTWSRAGLRQNAITELAPASPHIVKKAGEFLSERSKELTSATNIMHEADTVTTSSRAELRQHAITEPAPDSPRIAESAAEFLHERSKELASATSVEALLCAAAIHSFKSLKSAKIDKAFIPRDWGLIMTPHAYVDALNIAKGYALRELNQAEKDILINALFDLANAAPELNVKGQERVGKQLDNEADESTIIQAALSFLREAPEAKKARCVERKHGGVFISQYVFSGALSRARIELGRPLTYAETAFALDALYYSVLAQEWQEAAEFNARLDESRKPAPLKLQGNPKA